LNNCAFVSTKTIKDDYSKPFTFLMDASMLGVGVGFDTKGAGEIVVQYVRYPLAPKWTYNTVGGSPVFNQSATDYQDFELPESDHVELTLKILQYAGINIREMAVVQAAAQEEAINNQQET